MVFNYRVQLSFYYNVCSVLPMCDLFSTATKLNSKTIAREWRKLFEKKLIKMSIWSFLSLFLSLLHLDGMTDCSDSECCLHLVCKDHIMCISSNDPVDVLLRKQPPSVTASFYQRVKFLIEDNSVQSYARIEDYSERWVRNWYFI